MKKRYVGGGKHQSCSQLLQNYQEQGHRDPTSSSSFTTTLFSHNLQGEQEGVSVKWNRQWAREVVSVHNLPSAQCPPSVCHFCSLWLVAAFHEWTTLYTFDTLLKVFVFCSEIGAQGQKGTFLTPQKKKKMEVQDHLTCFYLSTNCYKSFCGIFFNHFPAECNWAPYWEQNSPGIFPQEQKLHRVEMFAAFKL